MGGLELLAWLSLGLLGLGLSALFSGLETGIYTINPVRLHVRAEHGDPAARHLQGEIRKPNRLLSTLLVGNNIANYLGTFSVTAIMGGLGLHDVAAMAVNAAVLVPMLFVFGETLPKDLFRSHTDQWSYRWAGFLTWCRRLLTGVGLVPIVQGFGAVVAALVGGETATLASARQRISQLIREGGGAGLLSESQTTLADRALALHARVLATEMIPWQRVVRVRRDAGRASREAVMRRADFTRLPVVDDRGVVVGILPVLESLRRPDTPVEALMTPAMSFGPRTPIIEALRAMRAQRQAMAIVVADDGRPRGLVTLKDLVEPLTGELGAW